MGFIIGVVIVGLLTAHHLRRVNQARKLIPIWKSAVAPRKSSSRSRSSR